MNTQCYSVHSLLQCTLSVTVYTQCYNVHSVFQCTLIVTVYTYCYSVHSLLQYTLIVTVYIHCYSVHSLLQYTLIVTVCIHCYSVHSLLQYMYICGTKLIKLLYAFICSVFSEPIFAVLLFAESFCCCSPAASRFLTFDIPSYQQILAPRWLFENKNKEKYSKIIRKAGNLFHHFSNSKYGYSIERQCEE